MGALLQFTMTVEHRCNCITCMAPVFMDRAKYDQLNRDKTNFYCINGHAMHWPQESAEEKLRKQLEFEKNRRESAEREAETARKAEAIVRGKLRATQERVGNGVCPCCNRSFTNLRRHMGTKHPEYKS